MKHKQSKTPGPAAVGSSALLGAAEWSKRALALLKKLEYAAVVTTEMHTIPACPSCWNWSPDLGGEWSWKGMEHRRGHKPNCLLAELINLAPNTRPERRGAEGFRMQTGRAITRPLQAAR